MARERYNDAVTLAQGPGEPRHTESISYYTVGLLDCIQFIP